MTTNIVSFIDALFRNEKLRAMEAVTSFITAKITQTHLWYLTLATKHAFRKKMLSTSAVQEIVLFLSEKFSVRTSGVEYAHAFTYSQEEVIRERVWLVTRSEIIDKPAKVQTGVKLVQRHWFHLNLLQKIQGASDNGLMEYSDALDIVTCAVLNYPEIKLSR